MSIEALWTARVQDVHGGMANGGIVVFESGRIFGGDSAYYYVGKYNLENGRLIATATIEFYGSMPATVWGDSSRKFNIRIEGEVREDQIIGKLTRPGMPGVSLNYVAVKRAQLP